MWRGQAGHGWQGVRRRLGPSAPRLQMLVGDAREPLSVKLAIRTRQPH